ncbi:MAG TPA: AHH domain-containing protein [Hyalangium sp.]|jgi:hypothetical protein|nr:AHH domain-containing protein [Hyalangium sp.]
MSVIHIPRTSGLQPIAIEEEEFQSEVRRLARRASVKGAPREAAESMFQLSPDSGNYLYLREDKKLVPMELGESLEGTLTQEDLQTAERYRIWCQQVHHSYGDCLGGALVGGRYLDMRGRYLWAMAMSKSPVLDELKKALGDMVNFRSLFSTALWTGVSMLLVLALNPVAPGLVAIMGTALVLYVGYDTLYNLVTGWFQLMEEVRYATTFEEIRAAGERFGKVIGVEAARAFVMLLMAAIGRTAHEFAAKLPTLPGSAQMAAQAEAQAGISLPALAEVQEIAVSAEGMSVMLPPGAMAMAAQAGRSESPCVETHHIATICNDKSALRGGPWTPRFRQIFAKAGMKLDDPANRVPIPGHKGPHPEEYHRLVFGRLARATRTCRTVEACRADLTDALRKLAKEIATPGTELNQLVTQGKPR